MKKSPRYEKPVEVFKWPVPRKPTLPMREAGIIDYEKTKYGKNRDEIVLSETTNQEKDGFGEDMKETFSGADRTE